MKCVNCDKKQDCSQRVVWWVKSDDVASVETKIITGCELEDK